MLKRLWQNITGNTKNKEADHASPAGGGAAPFDPAGLLKEAVEFHQNGRLAEAQQFYHRILTADPDHPEALQMMGMLAHQAGRSDVAVNLLSRACQHNHQVPLVHNNLGVVLFESGWLPEAEAVYRRA